VRVRSWGIPDDGIVSVREYEFRTDGQESSFVMALDTDPKEVERSQTESVNDRYGAFVHLYSTPFPPNHTGLMGPVWLALCSGHALKTANKQPMMMYPLIFMGPAWPDVEGPALTAVWNASAQPPYLPAAVTEFADANVFSRVAADVEKWTGVRLPAVYADGYTNAIYQVLEWTNAAGVHVPRHFRMVGFVPRAHGTAPEQLDVRVAYEGTIRALNVGASNPVVLPLQFPRWSRIMEYRYGRTNGQPYVYTSESGSPLGKEDLVGGRHIAAEEERALVRMRAVRGGKRVPVLAAIVGMSALFLGVAVALVRKRSRGSSR